jgi:hypothetical protein
MQLVFTIVFASVATYIAVTNAAIMKRPISLLVVLLLLSRLTATAQGRIVINEYLPWPLNGCGVTSEFIELLNFGPGPINIGCYIVTDGDYAITIPPNTILQPGQFYVISGQDIISQPCDNVDSTIHAHLNWNTCNCTSAPIPTTGDGFLTDGGSAAEQVVLLDPSLKVVDAVLRKLPAEPSSLITTSAVGGGCTPKTFDLDLMAIDYEVIGESDGRGNSMARKTDGDCGWVKDSRQSGNATNNTPGEISSLDASFYVTRNSACPPFLGSILIVINSGNMSEIFPMTYTLAYDSNNNNIFDFGDTYTTGIDSTPNTIPISGLAPGRYRIVIETSKGCNLTVFDFVIVYCLPLLNPGFISATAGTGAAFTSQLNWQVSANEQARGFVIQQSNNGAVFTDADSAGAVTGSGVAGYGLLVRGQAPYWRIKMQLKSGETMLSPVLNNTGAKNQQLTVKILGNPLTGNRLEAEVSSAAAKQLVLQLFDGKGALRISKPLMLEFGLNKIKETLPPLPPGIYFMRLKDPAGGTGSQVIKITKGSQAF